MHTNDNNGFGSSEPRKRPLRGKKSGKPIVYGPVDSNALCVLAAVAKSMCEAGESEQQIDEMRDRAMSGDYNHLLVVCMEYVEFRL